MSIELLFFIIAAMGIASKAFSKLCSNMISQKSLASFSVVLIVNGIAACLFFYISSGFVLSINGATALYSLIYALVAGVSVVSNLIVYKYASISNVTIISNSCGMFCTAILGGIFFSEHVSGKTVLRLFIMLAAMILAFVDQKRNNHSNNAQKSSKKRSLLPLILIVIVITACGCANTVVLKAFSNSTKVTDENSFFFFTNVILCIGSGIVFAIACLRKRGELKSSVLLLRPRRLVSVVGNTVCSNISSIVTVLIVAVMDVSLYSALSSAMGVLTGVIGSLLFKEKQGIFAYLAVVIACVAILI